MRQRVLVAVVLLATVTACCRMAAAVGGGASLAASLEAQLNGGHSHGGGARVRTHHRTGAAGGDDVVATAAAAAAAAGDDTADGWFSPPGADTPSAAAPALRPAVHKGHVMTIDADADTDTGASDALELVLERQANAESGPFRTRTAAADADDARFRAVTYADAHDDPALHTPEQQYLARAYAELDAWADSDALDARNFRAATGVAAFAELNAAEAGAAAYQADPDADYFADAGPSAHRGVQSKGKRCALCQVWLNQTDFDTARLAQEAITDAQIHSAALKNMLTQLVAGANQMQQQNVRPYTPDPPPTPKARPPPILNAPLQLIWSFPFCVNEAPVSFAEALVHAIKAEFGMSVNCTRARIADTDTRVPQSITSPLTVGV